MNKKIYPNVKLGKNVEIGDFVILGIPPKGKEEGELELVIGDNSVIRSHTVIYAGNVIGNNFQTGHNVTIRELNIIKNNVSIGTGSCIEHHINIEDDVRLHSQVFIPEYTALKKGCWIGPNVVITNAKYPKSNGVKDRLEGAIIYENAIIGANSTILPSVKIGKSSIIGAGSVITKNVKEYEVVVGNPQKNINSINKIKYY